MDHLQTRLDALEQRTHTVERQLRWWRSVACGLLGLAVLTWALPAGTAPEQGLAQRVAALEDLLQHFSRKGNEVFITGANLHIVNGLADTETTNALGNLIVGYNEPFGEGDVRTGSHNVVVGKWHNFSSSGGLVVEGNEISGLFAVVSGGTSNTASGNYTSISGGTSNTASNFAASVSGGRENTASGDASSVSGGQFNEAVRDASSVSGGDLNRAGGLASSVSGGWTNVALGNQSSVSGGFQNEATGDFSSVSGGREVVQETEDGWAAGSVGSEVAGRFRSP
jgi:hypothetical protein